MASCTSNQLPCVCSLYPIRRIMPMAPPDRFSSSPFRDGNGNGGAAAAAPAQAFWIVSELAGVRPCSRILRRITGLPPCSSFLLNPQAVLLLLGVGDFHVWVLPTEKSTKHYGGSRRMEWTMLRGSYAAGSLSVPDVFSECRLYTNSL